MPIAACIEPRLRARTAHRVRGIQRRDFSTRIARPLYLTIEPLRRGHRTQRILVHIAACLRVVYDYEFAAQTAGSQRAGKLEHTHLIPSRAAARLLESAQERMDIFRIRMPGPACNDATEHQEPSPHDRLLERDWPQRSSVLKNTQEFQRETMSMKRPSGRRGLLQTNAQVAVLASAVRQEIVETLESLGCPIWTATHRRRSIGTSVDVEMDASLTSDADARQTWWCQGANVREESTMNKIELVAVDLAKRCYQIVAIDVHGNVLYNRKLSASKFKLAIHQLEPTIIAMEACSAAHHWGRRLEALGHEVRLVPPQHAKAFRRVHKSDAHDALSIAEAAQRPNIHFVPVKTLAQQDLQCLERVRERLVAQRTAIINQARGLAREYGVSIPKSRQKFSEQMADVLADADNELTPIAREGLAELVQETKQITEQLSQVLRRIAALASQDPAYERLRTIPGIGPITAP